jgi:hypothetical protein
MKGFARPNLQAFKVYPMAFIELEVTFGKIITHNSYQLDGPEKTGGDGGMASRAA